MAARFPELSPVEVHDFHSAMDVPAQLASRLARLLRAELLKAAFQPELRVAGLPVPPAVARPL